MQWLDAIHHMVDVYFLQAQAQDVTVGFADPRSAEVLRDLARLPGVQTTEPARVVSAKLRFGPASNAKPCRDCPRTRSCIVCTTRRVAASICRRRDSSSPRCSRTSLACGAATASPSKCSKAGGRSWRSRSWSSSKPTSARRPTSRWERSRACLHERPSVTAVQLRVDSREQLALFRELKTLPRVSAVTLKDAAVQTFNDTMARTILIFVSFFVVFSCTLAFGVTYNAARIALSERGRELATLRVLGFTRAEISYILLGETALLTLVALPLGCGFGYALARLIVAAFETELYRVPFVIEPATYAWAMVIGLAATIASALLVRRRLDRLDLIAVLKTRE